MKTQKLGTKITLKIGNFSKEKALKASRKIAKRLTERAISTAIGMPTSQLEAFDPARWGQAPAKSQK